MRRFLASAVVGLLTGSTLFVTSLPAHATTAPAPATPAALRTIEPLAAYVAQTSCDPHIKPGVAALAALLGKTYPGTTYGSARDCGTSTSEHYEGRALDWMVSVRIASQKARAEAILSWLFASDSYGNQRANLRRLGVMYVVWNNRIWGAWNQRWDPYQNCANMLATSSDDYCHRSHIHLSLSWEGAQKRTSFWTAKIAAPDFGSCIAGDLNWAPRYTKVRATPCPAHVKVAPSKGVSAFAANLVAYSGARANDGESGAVVSVIQQAVGAPIDGHYGAQTHAKVLSWQRAHNLSSLSGLANQATWRSFLSTYKH